MRAILATAALILLAGPALAQDKPKKDHDKPKRQTNVITTDEIDAIRTEAADAYQVVERLRPQYFRIRGGSSRLDASQGQIEIKVVVDNSGRGGLEVLRQIPIGTIREIRYLNGADASIQFGTNYGAGAILVFTR